jgi:hypothetical protein
LLRSQPAQQIARCRQPPKAKKKVAEPGAKNLLHVDDVDYIVEVDCEKYRWPQRKEAEPGPVDSSV